MKVFQDIKPSETIRRY